MEKVVLLGQALMDYLCGLPEDPSILDYLSLGKCNKVSMERLNYIISKSKLIYRGVGGCVNNTAIGLNKLGVPCLLHLSLTSDENGKSFIEEISQFNKIEVDMQILEEGHTAKVATFFKEGEREHSCGLYNHGSSNKLVLTESLKKYIPNSLLYFSTFSFLEEDSENIFSILEYAKTSGAFILFDAGGIWHLNESKIEKILKYSSSFIANNLEARAILSYPRLKPLINGLSGGYIVKNGVGPTEYYRDGILQHSIPVTASSKVVNTLGAGDAFAAGFISSILKREHITEAILMGNNCAKEIVEKVSAN